MRKLISFFLLSASLFAQGSRFPTLIGFYPSAAPPGTATGSINAAATWDAFGFRLTSAQTINTVSVYVSSVTGSLGATDLTCEIDGDTNGAPSNSALQSGTSTTAAGAGLVTCAGLTLSASANTQYWLVWKNANGTPASNYVTFRYGSNNNAQFTMSNTTKQGWMVSKTTNSGTLWTTADNNVWGIRVGFSSGAYDGFMATSVALTGTSSGVYSTRQAGVKFTTPLNGVTLNVIGLSFYQVVSGTPTGNLQYTIWSGTSGAPTLLATTNSVTEGQTVSANGWVELYFSSTQAIAPGTTLRVAMSESTQSDANTNRYDTYLFTIDGTAASEALTPFGATVGSYSTDSTNFTETATVLMPFVLILSPSTPFTVGTIQTNTAN